MSGYLLDSNSLKKAEDQNTEVYLYKEQIDDLYYALEKDDITAANRIIGLMGDSKNLLAEEPLTILLEYPDVSIRGNCALALGRLGDKAATRYLIIALNDPSAEVHKKVIKALDDLWVREELTSQEIMISYIDTSIKLIRSNLSGKRQGKGELMNTKKK